MLRVIFLAFAFRHRHIEQLAGPCDVVCPVGVSQEAIVSDAVETAGQDMQEKAPDELARCQAHGFVSVAALEAVVLAFEGDGVPVG